MNRSPDSAPALGSPPEEGLLYGAKSIAAFLGIRERQVRHMIEAGHIPTFKIGAVVAARRSTLAAWLDELEHPTRRAS
jgi:hypothetical protein